MDGGVKAGILLFDEKQPFVRGEAGAEHQPAQFTKEGITKAHECGAFDWFGQVVYENEAGHVYITKQGGVPAALSE